MSKLVTFNGHTLNDLGTVSNVSRPIAPRNIQLLDVPGKDGAVLGLTNLEPLEITLDLVVYGAPTTRAGTLRTIGGILNEDIGPLAFGDDNGLYYMAVPSGGDIERYIDAAVVSGITFTIPEPILYGETVTETAPATLEVGGTYPTRPTITLEGVTPTQGLVTIRVDGGEFVRIATDASTITSATIDCESRTVRINGQTAIPTIDSDWLELAPGSHTLAMEQGTGGTWSLSYIERWV